MWRIIQAPKKLFDTIPQTTENGCKIFVNEVEKVRNVDSKLRQRVNFRSLHYNYITTETRLPTFVALYYFVKTEVTGVRQAWYGKCNTHSKLHLHLATHGEG